ncbi:MAG: YdcF family protein [Pseudomonadota bacterium]
MSLIATLLKWAWRLLLYGFWAVFAFVVGAAVYFSQSSVELAQTPKADAIVVLSADLDGRGELGPFSSARTERGVELWKAGVAPTLLFTGGFNEDTGKIYSIEMAKRAEELGVPESAIRVEGRSVSTFENARLSLVFGRRLGWEKIILVTDDYHMFRAWLLFEFWDRDRAFSYVNLSVSHGWAQASWSRVVWIFVREALAYPFNVAKVAAQLTLEAQGKGQDRTIR